MPPSLRRRGGRAHQQHHVPSPSPLEADDTDSDVELGSRQEEEHGLGDDLVGLGSEGEEQEEEEGDEELDDEKVLGSPNHANETPLPNLDPPPPYLREISTLASWTVSSSKPGCSIPQLRHPNTNLFWQSDGPQPHYLNIHFFKLVRIVGLRLYLDFEQDESYTPTKIIFLAGSGLNDLQEWGEMRLESPRGWVWADFSGVGDPDSDDDGDDDEGNGDGHGNSGTASHRPQRLLPETSTLNGRRRPANDAGSSDSENAAPTHGTNVTDIDIDTRAHDQHEQHTPFPPYPSTTHTHPHPQTTHTHTRNLRPYPHPQHPPTPSLHHQTPRPNPRLPFTSLSPNPTPRRPPSSTHPTPSLPVLRAHLVQIKILENHQNGKDTHLRGLQIFASNDEAAGKGKREQGVATAMIGAAGGGGDMVRRKDVLELGGGISGLGLGMGTEGVIR